MAKRPKRDGLDGMGSRSDRRLVDLLAFLVTHRMTDEAAHDRRRRHVLSTGRYSAMAPNLLPAIARLVNVVGVDSGDRVLDVGCGSGTVALTARRVEADVGGVDLSPQMLDLACESAALPAYDDLRWIVGDAEGLGPRRCLRDRALELRPRIRTELDDRKPRTRASDALWRPRRIHRVVAQRCGRGVDRGAFRARH